MITVAHVIPAARVRDGRTRALLVVGLSGLAVGISLVSLAAAGNLLRSPQAHDLSASRYGTLFLVLFAHAVLASGGAARLSRRIGWRGVYGIGMGANAVAMVGLALTPFTFGRPWSSFLALLLVAAALGVGFGAALAALNGFAARLFPARPALGVTGLHTLLGVGTALPPLLLPLAQARGVWWALPGTVGGFVITLGFLFVGTSIPAAPVEGPGPGAARGRTHSGAPFVRFAVATLFYGMCEAVLSNWGPVFLHEERLLPTAAAGAALSSFWIAVTSGRLITLVTTRWISPRLVHGTLPLLVAAGLASVPLARTGGLAIVIFAVAGLGCSAFLPLTLSAAPASLSGGLLAVFLTGSGLGTFGVGLLHDRHLTLGRLFPLAVAAALIAGAAVWIRTPPRNPVNPTT